MPSASSLFNVVGKNVLVTGGSRGIGFMIAKGFVQAGANVILTSRDEKACSDAVTTILDNNATEGNCRYVTSTLSTRHGCEDLAKKVQTMLGNDGPLHVLINNAGTSWGEDPWNNFDYDDKISSMSKRANWGFDKVLDLNVKSIFYLTRACVPLLQCSKDDPGRVVNIGSVAGILPQAVPTHAYDISKAAVHHLTKKLASDLASQSITVNAVAPGYVPSRMSQGLLSWSKEKNNKGSSVEEKMQSMARNIPLGRLGNEDDMVGACLYFTSKAGSWCTGVILNVDGGQVGTTQLNVNSSL